MLRFSVVVILLVGSQFALAQTGTNPSLWNKLFSPKEEAQAPAPAEKKASSAPKKSTKKQATKKPEAAKPSPTPENDSSGLNNPPVAAESTAETSEQRANPAVNASPAPTPTQATEPSFWQRVFGGASSTSKEFSPANNVTIAPQESAPPTASNVISDNEQQPAPTTTLDAPATAQSPKEAEGPSFWQRVFGGASSTSKEISPTTNPTTAPQEGLQVAPAVTPNPPTAMPNTPTAAQTTKGAEGPAFWQSIFGGATTSPTTTKSQPAAKGAKPVSPPSTTTAEPVSSPAPATATIPNSIDPPQTSIEKKASLSLATVCHNARCDLMVLFDAPINKTTVDQFEQESANLPSGTGVLLNSISGDLNSGIRLGQIFRQKRLNTKVGLAKLNRNVLNETDGKCFSACALAFMGGINRTLDPNDQFGVYALKPTTKTMNDAEYRQAISSLGLYVEQMGVDRRFVEQIAQAHGSNPQLINFNTAKLLNIDNNPRLPVAAWRMQALDDGLLIALISTRQSSGQFNLTLGITRENNDYRLTVFLKPQSNNSNLSQIAEFLNKNARLRLTAGSQTFTPSTIKAWSASGTGIQTAILLSNKEINALVSVLEFELNLSFANKNSYGIDAITIFGTSGLKGAITALKK